MNNYKNYNTWGRRPRGTGCRRPPCRWWSCRRRACSPDCSPRGACPCTAAWGRSSCPGWPGGKGSFTNFLRNQRYYFNILYLRCNRVFPTCLLSSKTFLAWTPKTVWRGLENMFLVVSECSKRGSALRHCWLGTACGSGWQLDIIF